MSDLSNKNSSPLPAVIDVDWLVANQQRDDLVILDASWHMPAENRNGAEEWQQLRIPGSRYFDFDTKICRKDTDLPHMAADTETFNTGVRKLGVNQHSTIVIYDSLGVVTSPRAWWMFKAMGHANVAVLNGGLAAWRQAGQAVESGETPSVEQGDFSADKRSELFRDSDAVQAALEDTATLVLDARSAARFNAAVDEPRKGLRRGHMPGALNLPFTDLLDQGMYLADPVVLKQAFAQLGIADPEQPLMFSCGSGVTACVLALAAEQAGFSHLSVYDGSWAEWGRFDNDFPVAPYY